jgi:hypothetical protein
MEQERDLTHLSEDQLASFWAGRLSPEALERVAAHVDLCQECDARLETMEPAFSKYRRCLELVHARTARLARPEADLVKKMLEIEARRAPQASRGRLRTWRPAWLSGIAAALVSLAVLLVPRMGEPELRADTLLQQAANTPAPLRSNRHLRIKTAGASFDRPTVLSSEVPEIRAEAAIRARFVEAHYNWNDPLSPRSFADWRRGLKHKTSKVSNVHSAAGQPEQSIETQTDDGTLRDAALTLDANLLPVSAWFRFADQEWVEITTAPNSDSDPVAARSAWPAPLVPSATRHESQPVESLAERELSVRLAIDAFETGAGEPIEVNVDPAGAILVTTYHLAPELEPKLRASLERIQDVTLRSATGPEEPQPHVAQYGEPMDRAIHASQDAAFEAHLLAELAGRFDASTEAKLTAASKARLWGLRMKHAVEMNRDLARLGRELERQRGDFRPAAAETPDPLQIKRMAESATNVDRLITMLYAGTEPEAEQAVAWRQLAMEFGTLQGLADSYGRYVERRAKELE